MRCALAMLLATGCAVAPERAAQHPGDPNAPIGRVAPAPPSLRPGVVSYPDVPASKPPETHEHHHHAP